jgi:biopolymer transport protein ExbD
MLAQAAITQEAFKIELPKVLTPEEAQQTHILIAVTREGEIKIGTNTIPLENLHGYLLKQARRGKTNKVIIKADRSVHYGIVMSVMDTAKNAGLNSISLATEYQKAP